MIKTKFITINSSKYEFIFNVNFIEGATLLVEDNIILMTVHGMQIKFINKDNLWVEFIDFVKNSSDAKSELFDFGEVVECTCE